MNQRKLSFVLLAATVAAWPALPAAAVDGVLEIHPACVAAGCFPGDGPGFPVEITQSGSYRLTGNLVVTDQETTAILTDTADVSIDLNGFAILGVTTCTFDPGGGGGPSATGGGPGGGPSVTCSPVGSGLGIDAGNRGVSVRRGTVRGMGGGGVLMGRNAVIEDVLVKQNGGTGVRVASGRASGIAVDLNLLDGFVGLDSTLVDSSVATQNGDGGFRLARGRLVGSAAIENVDDGVECGQSGNLIPTCSVDDNRVVFNGGDGISIPSAGCRAMVRGNVVNLNGGVGLSSTNAVVAYAENILQDNIGGTVSGLNTHQIGLNVCDGDTTCP